MEERPKTGAFLLIAIALLCVYLARSRLFLPGPVSQVAGVISMPQTAGARLVFKEPIDINTSTAKDLALLPGIGAKLSQGIIDERLENGRYRSIDELSRVKGLSPGRLKRVAPYIMAGGEISLN